MYRTLSSRCFILALFVELALSQAASTVLTLLGQNASFSFKISRSPAKDDPLSIKNEKNQDLFQILNGAVMYIGGYVNRAQFTGITSENQLSFVLRGVTLEDAGRYTAVLPGMLPDLVGEQILIVKASPSKPQIVELNGPAVAGSDYHLDCSARSNSKPPNHNLSMFSEWRRDNIPIKSTGRYTVHGTELNITGLSYGTDNGVRLTCVAFEDQLAKSVNTSDEHIIDVKYGPDNIQPSPSSGVITQRENGQIIVNCTADCNPPCSFQWRKDLVPTSLSENQTLIIKTVSKNDTGRYLCSIRNNITGRSNTTQITIMIIYGPASVKIVSFPSGFSLKVEENTTVNINCSADCHPDCNFTWSGPQGFFKTGAHLSEVINRDKGGNYTCIATNLVNLGKTATVSVTVLVLYGPGNSVNLGSINPTLDVELNQTAPDITCSATCNPPCDYHWYKNGTFYINGTTLSLGVVEKTTGGNYRCEAYTIVFGVNRSSTTSVNITVYYAPEVQLKPTVLPRTSNVYIVKLGQTNVGLTCVVIDASPPVQQFIWTKDRHEIQTQTNQILTISMVTKDTVGIWGCKGVNSKGNPLESILDVDVHYGPIITNLPNLTKVEGNIINVTCIVDSRPHPSSTSWTKSQNNTFIQDKAEMYIANLNRADKGTYECTAVNTIQPTGESVEKITVKSNYTLDVTYGAGILNLSVHDDSTVNENSSAIFQCRVNSNPPSFITWMRESNSTVLKTESGVVQSLYRIESAECSNTDNYTCSAFNGIGTPTNETVKFFVRCHPRTNFQLTFETKVYRKRHEGAVLRYAVISYPLPTFSWTFLGNGSESRGLPASASQHNSGLQSELQFTRLDIDDFGNYSVVADNSLLPSAREVFEIILADIPEVPSNVMIVEITQTSVKVQWVAGNNGGPQQTFHIVASAGSLTQNVTASDPGYRQNGTAVLKGLLPKTEYSIYMTAINSAGSSKMTDAIIVTTLEELKPDSGNNFPLSAVAGGIGAGGLVLFSVVVALFLWRRYQQRGQHPDDIKQGKIDRPRPESGLVDNPVYDSSGPAPGPFINNDATGVEYAEVVKPKKKASKMEDPSDVYTQVDKTKTNWKKGEEKGKHGKTSRGDIYENAYMVGNRSKSENLYQNSGNAKAEPCGENFYKDPGAATSSGPLKNKDGLLYADLMLDPPTTQNGKYVIRGIENRTYYAEIAYGKRGELLPDSDHEQENIDLAKRSDQ